MKTSNRWALINKNSAAVRTTKRTRAAARMSKRPSERIYDNVAGHFVR